MNKQSGFTMVEVMVSVVVLAFGALGMAGLQMQAINNSEQGRYSSIAAIEASSVVATMKANVAYWGSPPSTVSVQGIPAGTASNAVVTGGPTGLTFVACPTTSLLTFCTPVQMAYNDLATWGANIANTLPVGTLGISCNTTVSPAVCLVTISWQEKNVALHNPQTGASGVLATGTVQTHSYQSMVSVL